MTHLSSSVNFITQGWELIKENKKVSNKERKRAFDQENDQENN